MQLGRYGVARPFELGVDLAPVLALLRCPLGGSSRRPRVRGAGSSRWQR